MFNLVIEQLQKVLFLEPIPHEMRDYVAHTSVKIAPSASNLSAVLSSVLQKAKGNKPLILKYLTKLSD